MAVTIVTIILPDKEGDDLRVRHLARVARYFGGSITIERKEKK